MSTQQEGDGTPRSGGQRQEGREKEGSASSSLPSIDLKSTGGAGTPIQNPSPRRSKPESEDSRSSPRASGGTIPSGTIPSLSTTSTFNAAVDATSNMVKQLLPSALSPRSPGPSSPQRSPTAASGGIVQMLSQSLRLRRTPSSEQLNIADRPIKSPRNADHQREGIPEGKHDELADMSLELIIEALPAREMFIKFCKEQFGCPQKPRFLGQARAFRTEGPRMPTKEALRFSTFLMDTYVKAGAAQDVGLSAEVLEQTQTRWEAFKEHIQELLSSMGSQGEKAIAAAVNKKLFATVFAAAQLEVSIYLNEKVLPALRASGGDQADRIHRTSLDWASLEGSS